jgi:hypothetical protein
VESELTQYMIIFAAALVFLMAVVATIFVIAMLREMRLKAEETVLVRNGYQLDPVVIRHHLHHLQPMNGVHPVAYPQEKPSEKFTDTPVTRIPKPLYVRPTTEKQTRSVEVAAVTVEQTRQAG